MWRETKKMVMAYPVGERATECNSTLRTPRSGKPTSLPDFLQQTFPAVSGIRLRFFLRFLHAGKFFRTGVFAIAFESEYGQSAATAGDGFAPEEDADGHDGDNDDDDEKRDGECAHDICR